MKNTEEIELGEEVLIDETIWAIVEEIWNDTFLCVDRIGGEHEVTADRIDVVK
mgnify:CR=1 FL=1